MEQERTSWLKGRLRALRGLTRFFAGVGSVGRRNSIALGLVICVAVTACGTTLIPPPGPDCPKTPVHMVLHFDSAHLWADDLDTGRTLALAARRDAAWTFDPGPPKRLVDAAARDVVHDGDIVYQACYDRNSGTYFVGPDDVPNQQPGA